jgi:hypothetical protein
LQVDTLHWKYFAPNGMSVRQAVQRSQVSAMLQPSLPQSGSR